MNFDRSRFFQRFIWVVITTVSVWFAQHVARAQADKPINPSQIETSQSVFTTYQTERGVATRELSPAEASRFRFLQNDDAADKPAITITRARSAPGQNQFRFTLTPTAQLDANSQAKAAVQRALTKWADSFDNDVTTAVRVDFGSTLFGNAFPTADTVAVTSVEFAPVTYEFLAALLSDRSFNLSQRALYEAFPQGVFNTELGSVSRMRLQSPLGKVTGAIVAGFTNPVTIGFNSNRKYDFDSSDGIDADKLDFEALVLREIGRALGFVSSAGSAEVKYENPANTSFHDAETMWDIFRFRDQATLAEFNTAKRAQLSGGKHVFFAGGQELLLSTGRPDGKGGDGRPAGHWKDDELTGQYLGIMDPTFAPGERGGITANDLSALDYFGYTVFASVPVMEVMSNDDNSAEETLSLNDALAVTRLMPNRYPCQLQSVRLRLPQAAPGQQLRVIAFADAARTGAPPSNPKLLYDRMLTIPAVPENRWLELMLPNAPTIEAGDVYIGVQTASGVTLAGDANVGQHRSFLSTDNGASFQPLKGTNQQPVNLMVRAVAIARYGDPTVPEITAFSPATVAPGSDGFLLTIYGKHFYGVQSDGFKENSIVRWNGQEHATEFVNGSLLKATISELDVASAGTARVTVVSKNELNEVTESAPVGISITPTRPVPVVERLAPAVAPTGGEGFNLVILGKNFNRESTVKWNGVERAATVYGSTEISLPVAKADLKNSATVEISVFTPGPGGGASNNATFVVAPCSFNLSAGDPLLGGYGTRREIFVTTGNQCRWSAQSNAPWAFLTGGQDVLGSGLFILEVESNFAEGGRTAVVSVANTSLQLRQSGFAKSVSAASFAPQLAAESIASVFTLGHGAATEVATTNPLPTTLSGVSVKVRNALGVTRTAPLFFISPEQINFQVPAGTSTGTATVFIETGGVTRNYGQVQITQFAPGLFAANASGNGVVAAVALRVQADGKQRYEPVAEFDPAQNRIVARPIDLGAETDRVFLLLFGTGWRGRTALDAFKVKIGGLDTPVSFAGAQPDFIGLDQLTVELPRSLKGKGESPINFTVDGKAANVVTVTIQ